MALTDIKVRTAKVRDKSYKLSDEKGLYLQVTSKGSKLWRYKYRYLGKEKLLAIGIYPDISLAEARTKRDEARNLLANDIDPNEQKKAQKASLFTNAENTFEVIAREWLNKQESIWSVGHFEKNIRLFERDIFPWLGSMPIANITAPDLLTALRKIENRGTLDTVHRALNKCSGVFRYAIITARAQRDPSQDLRGAFPPVKKEHFAAITEPKQLGQLLRVIDGYQGSFIVACALRLAPLVFVRPGELRQAQWADIDLEKAEWRYLVTKTNTPHIVPLSKQAIAILKEIQPLTGHGQYVFPCARSPKRPMSNNAILAGLRRLGIEKDEMSGHGFRATARTILDEVLGVRPDFIEHQLAHAVRDPNGRAYNRTAHLAERKKMMQQWADYLERLRKGTNIIQFSNINA